MQQDQEESLKRWFLSVEDKHGEISIEEAKRVIGTILGEVTDEQIVQALDTKLVLFGF